MKLLTPPPLPPRPEIEIGVYDEVAIANEVRKWPEVERALESDKIDRADVNLRVQSILSARKEMAELSQSLQAFAIGIEARKKRMRWMMYLCVAGAVILMLAVTSKPLGDLSYVIAAIGAAGLIYVIYHGARETSLLDRSADHTAETFVRKISDKEDEIKQIRLQLMELG